MSALTAMQRKSGEIESTVATGLLLEGFASHAKVIGGHIAAQLELASVRSQDVATKPI
jgi:hypothetical protein